MNTTNYVVVTPERAAAAAEKLESLGDRVRQERFESDLKRFSEEIPGRLGQFFNFEWRAFLAPRKPRGTESARRLLLLHNWDAEGFDGIFCDYNKWRSAGGNYRSAAAELAKLAKVGSPIYLNSELAGWLNLAEMK